MPCYCILTTAQSGKKNQHSAQQLPVMTMVGVCSMLHDAIVPFRAASLIQLKTPLTQTKKNRPRYSEIGLTLYTELFAIMALKP